MPARRHRTALAKPSHGSDARPIPHCDSRAPTPSSAQDTQAQLDTRARHLRGLHDTRAPLPEGRTTHGRASRHPVEFRTVRTTREEIPRAGRESARTVETVEGGFHGQPGLLVLRIGPRPLSRHPGRARRPVGGVHRIRLHRLRPRPAHLRGGLRRCGGRLPLHRRGIPTRQATSLTG